MSLQDELAQIREQARTGAGVPSAEERYQGAQQHYEKLLGGTASFEQALTEQMKERDIKGAGIQEELRKTQAEIPTIRPQMLAKYGAPAEGQMPLMRPEDITSLIAQKETGKELAAQKLQDLYTRHAGTISDIIQRALGAYGIETELAGARATAAESAVERALAQAQAETELGWMAREAERKRLWEAQEAEKDRALQRALAALSKTKTPDYTSAQEKLRTLMENYADAVTGWGETGKMTREQFAALAMQDPEIGSAIPLEGEGGILWHTQQFWPETGAVGGTYLREWERPADMQANINQLNATISESTDPTATYWSLIEESPEYAAYLDYPSESPEDTLYRAAYRKAMENLGQ